AASAHNDPFVHHPRLTPTEHEVLTRLAEGCTPADIAAMHDVSTRLVNLHTGYAVAKLHVQRQRLHARELAATNLR
ncbi:MAG TPA: LuxR C-terminal-related transcriptional regulator, partial [Acidimicrobiales bacterium]